MRATPSASTRAIFSRSPSNFGPGRTFDASDATWRSEQLRVAGAPRGVWLGLTWRFGTPGSDAS